MSRSVRYLTSVCALVLGSAAFGPARADFSATFQGDYAHADANNGGGSADIWGGDASLRGSLGPLFGLDGQVDGGWHQLSTSGVDLNDGDINGSLFWQGSLGRLGGAVGYNHLDTNGFGSGHVSNYGGFGEWYAAPMVTVGAKIGDASLSNGGGRGIYTGGEIVWYVIPDVDANGTLDYIDTPNGHITNYSAGAEWLVSEEMPLSVYGGYTRSEISGGGSANVWLVGLKFYTNSNGSSTLVDRQRTGNVDWASHISNLGVLLAF